jgi:hypothetical protein
MKKIVVYLSILAFCACGSSKKKVETSSGNSSSMEQRLAEFMKLNEEMNLEKIMDYVYPKLFTIVPRNELLKAMKDGFNSEEVKIDIDSMKVNKIHPAFEMDHASYAKINYSMVMLMDFNNAKDRAAESDDEQSEFMRKTMAAQYGEENVTVDEATGIIKIRSNSSMVAVKEQSDNEWYFVNMKEDDPMVTKLFSKEVIDKIGTYK